MPIQWTPEQVLGLAPDDSSRSNARILSAALRKWSGLQKSDGAIWGECQGSGAEPYRCQVDLNGPAFQCSCPSRKLPCKHALGLFLIFTTQPGTFEVGQPPDWVSAWLGKRGEPPERKTVKAESKAAPDAAAQVKRAAGRTASREKKIRAGIDELEVWLRDLLRQGLASAQGQPHRFWENAAGRLVDAQAPGLARLVRDMAGISASGDSWQGRLLDAIGRLYLAMEGYRRLDSLPEATQDDLRSMVGITIKQEELLERGSVVKDIWLVLGRMVEEEQNLKTQRVWLWGRYTQRAALILNFAMPGGVIDMSLLPGTALPAELVYYPGAYPLRAAMKNAEDSASFGRADLPGYADFLEATAAYAGALGAIPWMERFPMAINDVIPFHDGAEWGLCDCAQRRVALARSFLHGWRLLAISGGRPVGVFGEWIGERLLPMSAWTEDQFYVFQNGVE